MTTVFVSHATVDRPFVEGHLIPFLQSHGLRTWYSKDTINTGAEWESAIRSGLQSSDWFLVVVSRNSIGSEWVRCEVDWALENRSTRLIPLLIETVKASELHLRLRLIQSICWNESPDAKENLLSIWGIRSSSRDSGSATPSPELKFDDYLYARPKNWYCIFCGWKSNESFNDYICKQCDKIRPFAGGSATMIKCRRCEGFSLALAQYCEWCGERVGA